MSGLSIQQMCQIVDEAPDWAKGYNTAIQKYTRSVWFSKDILLSDLKAQIDQHYYGQSEEKELEQYAILSQEKIEGGAVLVGGSCIQKMVDYQNVIAEQQSEIDQLKTSTQGLGDAVTRQLGIIVDREREIKQLRAQLNNMEQCYIEKKKQVDAVEHVLGCAMIGPKEVFAYASRIQEALRVSDDKLLNR